MNFNAYNIGEVNELKVTVLLDDYAGYETPFMAQHGISVFLQVTTENARKNIILDVGQSSEPILYNMNLLNIHPSDLDMIYLSHCHYDHTKGLVGILKECNKNITVIAHSDLYRKNFVLSPSVMNIGMDEENSMEKVKENKGSFILNSNPFSIMEGVISSGEVEMLTDFEKPGIGCTYNLIDGEFIPDAIKDDMNIIINIKDKGLFIVSGCSHSGIVNIINHAKKITGIDKVYGFIGGLHLIEATEEKIDKTIAALKEMDLKLIAAGHCTGLPALSKLMTNFKDSFCLIHSGKDIIL